MNEKSATGSAVKPVGQNRARIRKGYKIAPQGDSDPLAKIADVRIRELARQGSSELVTVLVELDLPVQMVEFRRTGLRMHSGNAAPFRVKAQTAAQRRLIDKRVSDASQLLAKVAVKPPRWLKSSSVFVVDAKGGDVGDLAKSPLFRAIRPNRVHLK